MAKTYIYASLATIVLLASIIYTTDAAACYNDAVAGGTATNCVYCQKAVSVAYTTVRSCVSTCVQTSSSFAGTGVYNYCCQTDYCNGATTTQVNLLAALLTSMCALWYLR